MFLEGKSVKILRYTLSSVQAEGINTLPSQHCGSPRLQGEWQLTVLQSSSFSPTSCQDLPEVHHGILLSFHNVRPIPVCSDT